MNKELKICMAGFGNLGQNFCKLVRTRQQEIHKAFGCRIIFTGICTRSMGVLVNPLGLDMDKVLSGVENSHSFDTSRPDHLDGDAIAMIEKSGADVFCELTSLSIRDGQPATAYIEKAFDQGMHVITANKGPEAWHYEKLKNKAVQKDLQFLFETIVMDGTPIFNFVKHSLPGVKIHGIKGILNSTSNFVLCRMEKGASYENAVKEAQRIGVAEADPSMDMEGWDGAAKICSLANILMGANVTPNDVEVESLSNITKEDIMAARNGGCKIKYICEAKTDKPGNKLHLSVTPEKIPFNDPYSSIEDTSSVITFYTDLAGELSIVQTNPGILQTAYGVYSDLLALLRTSKPSPVIREQGD